MTIVSTLNTQSSEAAALTENTVMLFVPNKPSCTTLLISDGSYQEAYDFCRMYFYSIGTSWEEFKPFAYAGYMLEEIEDERFDEGKGITTEGEYDGIYQSIQEWLREVISNFGEDVIVVCSDYTG